MREMGVGLTYLCWFFPSEQQLRCDLPFAKQVAAAASGHDAVAADSARDVVAATSGGTRIACHPRRSCNPTTLLLASVRGHLSPLGG